MVEPHGTTLTRTEQSRKHRRKALVSGAEDDGEPVMQLLLIRHGSRERGSPDRDKPLTDPGREEVKGLARALRELSVVPARYVTSTKCHSYETAERLHKAISANTAARIAQIDELDTRRPPLDVFDAVKKVGALDETEITALVGHEPSLGQLLMALTSERHRPLAHGSAVCLSASTAKELLKGKGEVDFRWPVVDYQEHELREKIRSKAGVATFLAGFTFTALTVVLSRSGSLSWYDIIATVALTVSLALFVACIYIYDSLSMPEGFWIYGARNRLHEFLIRRLEPLTKRRALVRRPRKEPKGEARDAKLRRDGPLYVYMVRTWTIMFTPAVVFGLIGFVALLLSSHRVFIYVGASLGIVLVTALYFWARPDLGYD
jgi:phosphohistidine phosphatase